MNDVIKVMVRDLQVGDVTTGSRLTIMGRPYDSVQCPSGYRYVPVRTATGRRYTATWRVATMMRVRRSS